MIDHPRVSVIMTAYNAGDFLRPAIDGLLAQTYRDFELVVIENGSTDGTREVLRSYADPRLRMIELEQNIGRTPGLIRALSEARGEYVANQDADDVSLPERLEKQVAWLDSHPDCVLASAWCDQIDENGERTGVFAPSTGSVRDLLPQFNPIAHSAAMYRRDAALNAGGYPKRYAFSQDFGLWVSLAGQGDVVVLPEILSQLRNHGDNMTSKPENDLLRNQDALAIMQDAMTLPSLSGPAKRAGRRAIGLQKGVCACQLWRLGRYGEALAAAASGLAQAPRAFAGRLVKKAMNG